MNTVSHNANVKMSYRSNMKHNLLCVGKDKSHNSLKICPKKKKSLKSHSCFHFKPTAWKRWMRKTTIQGITIVKSWSKNSVKNLLQILKIHKCFTFRNSSQLIKTVLNNRMKSRMTPRFLTRDEIEGKLLLLWIIIMSLLIRPSLKFKGPKKMISVLSL